MEEKTIADKAYEIRENLIDLHLGITKKLLSDELVSSEHLEYVERLTKSVQALFSILK